MRTKCLFVAFFALYFHVFFWKLSKFHIYEQVFKNSKGPPKNFQLFPINFMYNYDAHLDDSCFKVYMFCQGEVRRKHFKLRISPKKILHFLNSRNSSLENVSYSCYCRKNLFWISFHQNDPQLFAGLQFAELNLVLKIFLCWNAVRNVSMLLYLLIRMFDFFFWFSSIDMLCWQWRMWRFLSPHTGRTQYLLMSLRI